jgi:hypothetical protein
MRIADGPDTGQTSRTDRTHICVLSGLSGGRADNVRFVRFVRAAKMHRSLTPGGIENVLRRRGAEPPEATERAEIPELDFLFVRCGVATLIAHGTKGVYS